MIPQILLNVLQTGAKAFFDVDPTVTEHLTHHVASQAMLAGHACSLILGESYAKFADDLSATLHGITMKLQV